MRTTFSLVTIVLSLFLRAAGQSNPTLTLLGQMNAYSAIGYNDCWGYTAPDGREYALLGVETGTSIIDITDAPTLSERAFIPSANTPWKDIKTYRQYAYVVTDGSGLGLQIIDLSFLPDSARLVNTISSAFLTSHNLYVDTSRALLYIIGHSANPVRIWSLSDPVNPTEVSTFGPGASVHDVYARGNRAYVSEGSLGSFSVWDVTNPAAPSLLTRFEDASSGYAHNAWLSDDGNFLMTTEETSGKAVRYWDISDLNNVVKRGEYLGPTSLAHNTHIKGQYAYISHYKDGLKIVDLSNPDQLQEVASYNTYQPIAGMTSPYMGAWGAYPFFHSGKVLISDMQRGLFVMHFPPAVVTGVGEHPEEIPQSITLHPNYPNPFNPSTTIRCTLHEPDVVELTVLDMLGRKIEVLFQGELQAGSHTFRWSPSGVASGLYIYALSTSRGGTISRKMILAR